MGLTEWLFRPNVFQRGELPFRETLHSGRGWRAPPSTLVPGTRSPVHRGTSSALGEEEAQCPDPAHAIQDSSPARQGEGR